MGGALGRGPKNGARGEGTFFLGGAGISGEGRDYQKLFFQPFPLKFFKFFRFQSLLLVEKVFIRPGAAARFRDGFWGGDQKIHSYVLPGGGAGEQFRAPISLHGFGDSKKRAHPKKKKARAVCRVIGSEFWKGGGPAGGFDGRGESQKPFFRRVGPKGRWEGGGRRTRGRGPRVF